MNKYKYHFWGPAFVPSWCWRLKRWHVQGHPRHNAVKHSPFAGYLERIIRLSCSLHWFLPFSSHSSPPPHIRQIFWSLIPLKNSTSFVELDLCNLKQLRSIKGQKNMEIFASSRDQLITTTSRRRTTTNTRLFCSSTSWKMLGNFKHGKHQFQGENLIFLNQVRCLGGKFDTKFPFGCSLVCYELHCSFEGIWPSRPDPSVCPSTKGNCVLFLLTLLCSSKITFVFVRGYHKSYSLWGTYISFTSFEARLNSLWFSFQIK